MRIGIVTTWFERGAAYVSRAYMESLLARGHEVYIYARGGESFAKEDLKWNLPNVTYEKRRRDTKIHRRRFFRWIRANSLDALFFNEQKEWTIVVKTKRAFPELKIGAYVDYYTEETIPWYNIYDFIICNTRRHWQAMSGHPQSYYIGWGTDTGLFRPRERQRDSGEIVFFHSVGMSARKGTDLLLDAFIDGNLYQKAKLVIHTQIPIELACHYDRRELTERYGIKIIERTVPAPGLYHLGDVYVYPTRLDGLGLTLYEALSCGLPVITTDYPPMNEVIDPSVGRLVRVKRNYCRSDGYYWPMSVCDKDSLIEAMKDYIDHPDWLTSAKRASREKAERCYDWSQKAGEVSSVFCSAGVRELDKRLAREIMLSHYKHSLLGEIIRRNDALQRAYAWVERKRAMAKR